MDGKNLDWYGQGPDDALYIAVHSVALLIACTAHPRSRDTLYLAACSVVLASLGLPDAGHQRMLKDFFGTWVRGKTGSSGDPPAWNAEAVERVRAGDPWAAQFLDGLSESISAFSALVIPAPLGAIAEAARAVQAHATLAQAAPAGSA